LQITSDNLISASEGGNQWFFEKKYIKPAEEYLLIVA
jgi:hypothetical protein